MSLASITSAVSGISNLLFVSPQKTVGYQPQPAPGSDQSIVADPFVFHYEGEQTVSLESDITDHFVEDNTSVQDQISLKPETITTHGYIGELNDIAPNAILAALQSASQKLIALGAYTPRLSISALLAYNEAAFLYATASKGINTFVSAWATITGAGESVINGNGIKIQPNQNKQQVAFQQFYGYWRTRTLFTVQTPWAVFQNMAIKSLRSVQDADTNVITDFEVTFKLMRFVSSITTIATGPITIGDNSNMQGQASAQGAPLVDNGTSTLSPSISSFSSSVSRIS